MSKKVEKILKGVSLTEQQEREVLDVIENTQKGVAEDKLKAIQERLACSRNTVYTFDLKGLYDQIRLLYMQGKFNLVVRLSDVLIEYLPNED